MLEESLSAYRIQDPVGFFSEEIQCSWVKKKKKKETC